MSRYNRRIKLRNDSEQYRTVLEDRGVKGIIQYATPEKVAYEDEVYDSIDYISYTWKYGDMYWRLSTRFFGDPQYWYVIAAFNEKPTESHNKVGDVLKIPTSLADALQVVRE